MEINQEALEKLKKYMQAFLKAFREVKEQLLKFFREKWNLLKERIIDFYQFEVSKQKRIKHKKQMNFTRKKNLHQVIDRRPRQMIRKIIR